MLNRVSVTTLGGGRRAASPKPKTGSTGKTSHGGVSTNLISPRSSSGAVTKNRSSFASRPGTKPGTTHRVGTVGTARAGGNPRTATHNHHAMGSKSTTRHKGGGLGSRMSGSSRTSGIRISRLSVAGSRSNPSRSVLGKPRVGGGGRKVSCGNASKVRSARSTLHKTTTKSPTQTRHRVIAKSSPSRSRYR